MKKSAFLIAIVLMFGMRSALAASTAPVTCYQGVVDQDGVNRGYVSGYVVTRGSDGEGIILSDTYTAGGETDKHFKPPFPGWA